MKTSFKNNTIINIIINIIIFIIIIIIIAKKSLTPPLGAKCKQNN